MSFCSKAIRSDVWVCKLHQVCDDIPAIYEIKYIQLSFFECSEVYRYYSLSQVKIDSFFEVFLAAMTLFSNWLIWGFMSGVVFAEKYTLYKFSYKAQMNFNIPIKNPVLLFKLVNKKLEYFNYWIIRVRGSLRKEKSLKTGYNRYIKRCWFFRLSAWETSTQSSSPSSRTGWVQEEELRRKKITSNPEFRMILYDLRTPIKTQVQYRLPQLYRYFSVSCVHYCLVIRPFSLVLAG